MEKKIIIILLSFYTFFINMKNTKNNGTIFQPEMEDLLNFGAKNCKNMDDVQNFIKTLTWPLIEKMLQWEMESHLWYERYSKDWYNTWNSRNWYYERKIKTTNWLSTLNMPRDRNWTFEPQIIPKYQNNTSEIEQKIINMYALGLTTRDIVNHVEDIYWAKISADTVSNITDQIMPLIEERQSRPLDSCYPIIFLDAIHCKVKENEVYVNKAVYMVVWYNINWMKDVLGMYIWEEESSKFRQVVCNDLNNRWIKDVCIACVDWLSWFWTAIKNVFWQDTEIQRCIVHQLRNSYRYISNDHLKDFKIDLAKIYKAPNLSTAEANLKSFTEKREKLYPTVTKSWNENRAELSVYFVYSDKIRKLIYTTNIIESNNAKLRKVVRKWRTFPTEKSLRKLVYLAIINTTKKRTSPVAHRWQILWQLHSFFEWKLSKYL